MANNWNRWWWWYPILFPIQSHSSPIKSHSVPPSRWWYFWVNSKDFSMTGAHNQHKNGHVALTNTGFWIQPRQQYWIQPTAKGMFLWTWIVTNWWFNLCSSISSLGFWNPEVLVCQHVWVLHDLFQGFPVHLDPSFVLKTGSITIFACKHVRYSHLLVNKHSITYIFLPKSRVFSITVVFK